MFKWLRLLRNLELMPRPFGHDWTHIFLQKFEGNITILVISIQFINCGLTSTAENYSI